MQSSNNRNLYVAIALSLLVMGAWQYFVIYPKQLEAHRQQVAAEKAKQELEKTAAGKVGAGLPGGVEKAVPRQEVLQAQKGQRIAISTPTLHGSISTTGARLDDLTLANYRQTIDKTSPEVVLLSPSGSTELYFAETGWLPHSTGFSTPGPATPWKVVNGSTLTPQTPVTLQWDSPEGVRYTQELSVDDRYMFTIRQEAENLSKNPVSLIPYGMINRNRMDRRAVYISHEGMVGVLGGTLQEVSYDKLKEIQQKGQNQVEWKDVSGWLGIADQYWLSAFVPPAGEKFTATSKFYEKNGMKRYQVDYSGTVRNLKPGEKASYSQMLFAGAKKVQWLDDYRDKLSIPLFDRAVDYGWLYFITKPIYHALMFFQSFLGNFGISILVLTVCIKALLFPLANKSYKAMAHMRIVMPEMKEIQEKYKDDRVQLNQKMMEFYKSRKVNPAAGCLPVLVQIPIFFALYKTLYITIEMRHAPFYGWIHDLSAPDPTNILQLFGLLHWVPPVWAPHIGILPIVYMITMYIQQSLNAPPTDDTQKTVMKTLPLIFLFLFAGFPAGLVIYWIWSNTLTILQQYVITRKMNSHIPHPAKPAKLQAAKPKGTL